MAFVLIISVRKLIFDHENTFERARKYVPMYMWMVGFMISMVTLLKGLKHIGIDFDLGMGSKFVNAMVISAVIGLVVAAIGAALLRKVKTTGDINSNENIERIFGILMIFTACGMAFAHGSNDVANAVGPLAAVVSTVQSGGVIGAKAGLPWWVLGIGAAGIVVGLATYGWRVIQTIGRKITELTPSRGFAAELAAASTVVLASATGLPISTTHTLVGAVLGVGLARGVEALNLRVVGAIIASWVVTLPAGAGLAIVFFYTLSAIFGA